MPKCNDCGNTKKFIVTYFEFEIQTYEGNQLIDQEAGDRDRLDYWIDDTYKPECGLCCSINIEGDI